MIGPHTGDTSTLAVKNYQFFFSPISDDYKIPYLNKIVFGKTYFFKWSLDFQVQCNDALF